MANTPIRVLMLPLLSNFDNEESGIKRVVESYHRYISPNSVRYVECGIDDKNEYDLFAVHAGTTDRYPADKPIVAHLHGLYWTADYEANAWEWRANAYVVESIRRATAVTVPSGWVGESIARDARILPFVVPHGIEWREWEHNQPNKQFVLWNKNRSADVCNPIAVKELAKLFPNIQFVTTFYPDKDLPDNVKVTGLQRHAKMQVLIQQAGIYLSTAKETFGIGILEALASGTPVLGWDYGGNRMLVQHGDDGYLAKPFDYNDLAEGLKYCIKYREVLSHNAKFNARGWNWVESIALLERVYQYAWKKWNYYQRELYISEKATV